MSTTLNLLDQLLSRAKTRYQLGCVSDAFSMLTELSKFRDLPASVAAEAHGLLAEIHLRRRQAKKARRHLHIAQQHDSENARYYALMARALRQRESQWEQALTQYERALELDPNQAEWRADQGLLLIRLGYFQRGLDELRRACQDGDDAPCHLVKLARGLRLTGRLDEARRELRAAMFRHPRDVGIRRLWERYRFAETRRQQKRRQRRRLARAEVAPVLLRFERPATMTSTPNPEATIVRCDAPSVLPSPHRPTYRPDQRHVQ